MKIRLYNGALISHWKCIGIHARIGVSLGVKRNTLFIMNRSCSSPIMCQKVFTEHLSETWDVPRDPRDAIKSLISKRFLLLCGHQSTVSYEVHRTCSQTFASECGMSEQSRPHQQSRPIMKSIDLAEVEKLSGPEFTDHADSAGIHTFCFHCWLQSTKKTTLY